MSVKRFMTGEEKLFLKELVFQKADIIENKKSDAVSISTKKRAWVAITAAFNAHAENRYRTVEQLKKCWENMKARTKKELLAEKQKPLVTEDEGPYEPSTKNEMGVGIDIELQDVIDNDPGLSHATNEYSASIEDCNNIQVLLGNEQEQDILQPIPGLSSEQITLTFPQKTKDSSTSRDNAAERELIARLLRTEALKQHDEQLHLLKMREQELKIREQEMRIEEQKIRIKIAKEVWIQEKLKTDRLQQMN